eukprot:s2248_g8.t1
MSEKSSASPGVHSLAGSFAGAAQTAFWHPLDVLKTRMQVRDGTVGSVHAYGSLRQAVSSTWQSEGLRGFFRGVLPNVAGSTIAWGVQMPLYQLFKTAYGEAYGEETGAQTAKDSACSLAAGMVTNMVVHPIFLIKTRFQLQRGQGKVYQGIFHAVTTIASEEGLPGFYRGFMPSLMLCSHGAILLATYPLQVVRSVMQQRPANGTFEYTSAPRTAQLLWQRNGLPAFYRGILPQMMRTVPQAMAFFSIYEYALTAFQFLGTNS